MSWIFFFFGGEQNILIWSMFGNKLFWLPLTSIVFFAHKMEVNGEPKIVWLPTFFKIKILLFKNKDIYTWKTLSTSILLHFICRFLGWCRDNEDMRFEVIWKRFVIVIK